MYPKRIVGQGTQNIQWKRGSETGVPSGLVDDLSENVLKRRTAFLKAQSVGYALGNGGSAIRSADPLAKEN